MNIYGQSPSDAYIASVQHFTPDDGLSHRDVYCTFQDSRDFIWIGTKYGLNRFDGHNFITFTKEKDGLTHSEVHHILEDSEGWLWVFRARKPTNKIQFTDVFFIHAGTFEVKTLEERFGKTVSFSGNQIFSAIVAPSGTVFLGTNDGKLIRYNSEYGFKIHTVDEHGALALNNFQTNNFTITGGIKFNREQQTHCDLDTLGNIIWSLPVGELNRIRKPNSAESWLYSLRKGLQKDKLSFFELNKENKLEEIENFAPGVPNNWKVGGSRKMYYRETDDTHWFKDHRDFFIFRPGKGLIYDFKINHPQIIENFINDVYFDIYENIWVSTSYGIYKIQIKPNPFKKYLSLPKSEYTVNSGFSTRGILIHNDKLWITSVQPYQHFTDLKTGKKSKRMFSEAKRLAEGIDAWTIFQPVINRNSRDLIFAGQFLINYNTESNAMEVIRKPPTIADRMAWSLFTDSRGNVWMGTSKGLTIWEGKNG